MARRMFSDKVIKTDAFMEMPHSTKNLYFYLMIEADDDGFVSNPKTVMKMISAADDDYKILVVKKFIIPFDTGICVIKHWLIHNLITSDRKQETQWVEEKDTLKIDEKTQKYSRVEPLQPSDNQVTTKCPHRLGKDRVGEVSIDTPAEGVTEDVVIEIPIDGGEKKLGTLVGELIKLMEFVDPKNKLYYNVPPQRKAAEFLIEQYSFEEVRKRIEVLPRTNGMPYFPTITTPCQLRDKWTTLESAMLRKKAEVDKGKPKVAFS